MTSTGPDQSYRRSLFAVVAVFSLNGFALATAISRIPTIRERLGLSPGQLGLVLLSPGAGSLVGLPLAGLVVAHLGARRTVAAASIVMAAGVALAGLGAQLSTVAVFVPGFLAMGLGTATWDVAMNVEGAEVERLIGRSVMPRLHAAWSIGAVLGALTGTAAAALSVPIVVQLGVVAVVIATATQVATRSFRPVPPQVSDGETARTRSPLFAWKERRTLTIGLLLLTMAFCEGSGADWLAVTTVDNYGAATAVGSLAYAIFTAATTTGRLTGTAVIDRFGRVLALRLGALVSIVGVLLVVLGNAIPFALVGAAFWGLGLSLGFPLGMSAAADDPLHAAARVSVISSIGYTAFLAGPPLIGWIADRLGGSVQHALSVTAILLVIGMWAAGATAPLPGSVADQRREALL